MELHGNAGIFCPAQIGSERGVQYGIAAVMCGCGQRVKCRGFGYKAKNGFGVPFSGKRSNAGQHLVSVLPDTSYLRRISLGILRMLFNALHLYFKNFPVLFIQLILVLRPQVLENGVVNDENDSACQVEQAGEGWVLRIMNRIEYEHHHKE